MAQEESLGILEVIENLNSIVEAAGLEELEITDGNCFISHRSETGGPRELYWIAAGANDLTLEAIRQNFRAALKHLRHFYKKMKSQGGEAEHRTLLEIQQVLVLVGEAAAKLEKFDALFREKIPVLEEFIGLQKFYKNVVVSEKKGKELFYETVAHDVLAESHESAAAAILDDLQIVKGDQLWELFYLKNESGNNFYTKRLAEKLKLTCDFGVTHEVFEDPLVRVLDWQDKRLQLFAKQIYDASKADIARFYSQISQYKQHKIVSQFHQALMALLLATNPKNLIRQFSSKGCALYFADFLCTLRSLISDRDYQKYFLFTIETPDFLKDLIRAVSTLIFSIYTTESAFSEMTRVINELVEARERIPHDKLSQFLQLSFEALEDLLKKHPNGPLFKALDLIRAESMEAQGFDPWLLGLLPSKEAVIEYGEKSIALLRLPAPVHQEMMNKASITEEFVIFLNTCNSHAQMLLYIDFQDRTSRHEHARTKALEALSREAQFTDALIYLNWAKQTDFYHQSALYRELKDKKEFVKQFYEHISDEGAGYYFPAELRRSLFPTFIKEVIESVSEHFFKGKSQLESRERTTFIEIVYNFLILKLIEVIRPDFVALSSKDGLDLAATSEVAFLAFLHYGNRKANAKSLDFDRLRALLFGPTLFERERVLQSERFQYLLDLIVLLEKRGDYFKTFSSLYKSETFEIKVVDFLK